MATELAVAREFTDRAITEHCADRLANEEAAMVKWWDTELCNRVTDRCVQSIFGGTTEIQKEIIGRSLGL
jgi:alkylation response protein AidB-like acyl-CoA dehydrogenase